MNNELKFLNKFVTYFGFYGITDYKYILNIGDLSVLQQKKLFDNINSSIETIEKLYSLRDFNLGRCGGKITSTSVALAILKKCLQKTGIPYETYRLKGKSVMRLKSFSKLLMVYIRHMNTNSRANEVREVDKSVILGHYMTKSYETVSDVKLFNECTKINICVPYYYLVGDYYNSIISTFNPKIRQIIETDDSNSFFYIELLRHVDFKMNDYGANMECTFNIYNHSLAKSLLIKVDSFLDDDDIRFYIDNKHHAIQFHKLELANSMKFYYCYFQTNLDATEYTEQLYTKLLSYKDKQNIFNINSKSEVKVTLYTNLKVQSILQNEFKIYRYSNGVCFPLYSFSSLDKTLQKMKLGDDKNKSSLGDFTFIKMKNKQEALMNIDKGNVGFLKHYKKGSFIFSGDVIVPNDGEKVKVKNCYGTYELSATVPLYHCLSQYSPFYLQEDTDLWCVFMPLKSIEQYRSSQQISSKDAFGKYLCYTSGCATVL